MSEKPYDNLSRLEGALRRVYQARRSLSHVDAGVVETTEEFELLASIVDDLEELEECFEQRIGEEQIVRTRQELETTER